MRSTWGQKVRDQLLHWSVQLQGVTDTYRLRRAECPLLIFFHGDSLAHTIRPLVMARSLRKRGYPVVFAGTGVHQSRIFAEGFPVHEVATLPQSRMDEYVARGDYAYYDQEWIERCVTAERRLIRQLGPELVLGDMRPTLRLSAALEGVDLGLVKAAYNQPGYPFPIRLPETFPLNTALFDEFLSRHTADLQPHSRFYLLADVPEFHPPGSHTPAYYHYVGPLIEEVPEPRSIPILADEGWDTRVPLIYFNGGSTGAEPTFLDAMLRRLAQLPYRVLVTTAGRWSGTVPSPNLRIVDFLPAAWVLRRAALFVGIGGIGSIYHALRQGVPILGAPEHLDQEYHLNRVRDLGLGLKLHWEAFHQADPLVAAIERLFAHYSEFKQRCEAFAPNVQVWQDGDAVAGVVDRHFIARQSPYPLAAEYRVSEAEFTRHLLLSTPPGLTAAEIRQVLREGVRRGMPHQRQGALLCFDRAASWNWLYDHEPRFFESDYQALEEKRQVFFTRRNGGIIARKEQQRYRLTYALRVYPQTLPAGWPVSLFLPYPIPDPCQRDIRLCACQPVDLQPYLVPRAGFFYGYPLRCDPSSQEPLEFSYTCEVTVRTRDLQPLPSPSALSPEAHQHFTAIEVELADSEPVRHFFQELKLDRSLLPVEKARQIYLYLARSKRFQKTKERCQCMACSAPLILSADGGHCITLTRAFIALCRLEGIPAREVTGALAGYPAGEGRFEMAVFNELLFGHTWAEVFVAEYGWLPVEFHGIVIGRQAMTADNVADPALREQIAHGGDAYLEYYFGHLDCHRVVCSNSVKQIPQLLVRETSDDSMPQVSQPSETRHEGRLVFECI